MNELAKPQWSSVALHFFLLWCASSLGSFVALIVYTRNFDTLILAALASAILFVPAVIALALQLWKQHQVLTFLGYIFPWLLTLAFLGWVWWKDSQVKVSDGSGQYAIGLGIILLAGGIIALLGLFYITKLKTK